MEANDTPKENIAEKCLKHLMKKRGFQVGGPKFFEEIEEMATEMGMPVADVEGFVQKLIGEINSELFEQRRKERDTRKKAQEASDPR